MNGATAGPVDGATAGPVAATAPAGLDAHAPEFDAINFNSDGLVPGIVQDASSKDVLMLAWMDREAIARTMLTGRSWFWSRSRKEYWCKGETSGDRQRVRRVLYDCDADVLLLLVDQEGRGACHTGEWTCFYRSLGEPGTGGPTGGDPQ